MVPHCEIEHNPVKVPEHLPMDRGCSRRRFVGLPIARSLRIRLDEDLQSGRPEEDLMSKTSFAVAGASCLALALALGIVSEAAETATSVWEGVYTKEQAARGKTRYFASCAVCHGP